MSRSYRLVLLAIVMGVAACSNNGDGRNAATDSSSESSPASSSDAARADESVFDPLVGTLDRAEAVEDMGMERKDELDRRMEDM